MNRRFLLWLCVLGPVSLQGQESGLSGSVTISSAYESGRPLVPYQRSRGANGLVEADLRFDSKWLQIRANPRLWAVQNRAVERFPVGSLTSAQWPLYRKEFSWIDLPEAYGTEPAWRTHWGETRVAVGHPKVRFGVSTESRAWGAGQRQHLLLSDHSLGFWHGFAELDRIPIGLGTVGMTVIAGRLDSSGYARFPMPKEWRVISGVDLHGSPHFVPGLTVGLIRMFVQNGSQVASVSDWFPFLQPFQKAALGAGTDGGGSQPDNQLASVYFRWNFQESGVQVYGEYARDDHSLDFRDAFLEPDHMRAYVWGVSKRASDHQRLGVEMVNVSQVNPKQARASGWWYTNANVRHGHTHLGQLLGAEIGPGSRSVEAWMESESLTLSLRRVDVDRDLYDAAFNSGGYRPEVDWIVRMGSSVRRGAFSIHPELSLRHTRNRFYLTGNHETSVGAGLSLRWSFLDADQ